jgi:hypothetical protein
VAVRDDPSTRTDFDRALRRFASEHIALIIPFGGALVFFLRCLVVSRGNRYTAWLLLTQTSIGDALRALLLTAVILLLITGWVIAAYSAFDRAAEPKVHNPGAHESRTKGHKDWYYDWIEPGTLLRVFISCVSFLGFVLVARLSKWTLLLAPLPVAVFFGWIAVRRAFHKAMADSSRFWAFRFWFVPFLAILTGTLIGLLWALFSVSILDTSFWLPGERLVFKGERALSGYVLKTNEDHLIILQDHPRIIIEKPKANLLERELCYPPNYKAKVKSTGRELPDCP